MIDAREMKYIISEIESGKMDAVAAHRAITALKNQQKEIHQLSAQISRIQISCRETLHRVGYG